MTATVTRLACGCPQHPGRQVSDPARHAAWHQLVLEQGGPAGEVSTAALRRARGFLSGTPTTTSSTPTATTGDTRP